MDKGKVFIGMTETNEGMVTMIKSNGGTAFLAVAAITLRKIVSTIEERVGANSMEMNSEKKASDTPDLDQMFGGPHG